MFFLSVGCDAVKFVLKVAKAVKAEVTIEEERERLLEVGAILASDAKKETIDALMHERGDAVEVIRLTPREKAGLVEMGGGDILFGAYARQAVAAVIK